MSAVTTTEQKAGVSPRARARITGVVYLLYFLLAILGEVFLRQAGISVVQAGASGDAATTAQNILAHNVAYRVGWALGLISTAFYVAVVGLLYQLFRPVNRSLALLAAFFGLVGCATMAVGSLFQLAPLIILRDSPYLSAFSVEQTQALAQLSLNLGAQVGGIALVFFGLFQILIGYLMIQSIFLPRILGVLMALAGVAWLSVLVPPLAYLLGVYVAILGFLAEVALMLWLVIVGVNARRWTEQATVADAL
jgi:hypothetical protein